MAENSKIEWTTHTFNPWRGCTKVSAGCTNCYAETLSKRNPRSLGVWGPRGTRVVAAEAGWKQPVKWNREAEGAAERPRVFCASLADVFEGPETMREEDWPKIEEARRRLFALIDATPHLDWLLLTKRPENIRKMWPLRESEGPYGVEPVLGSLTEEEVAESPREVFYRENVWLMTSVEDQETFDERWPLLAQCRDLVPVLGLSGEPLIGPIVFPEWWKPVYENDKFRGYDVPSRKLRVHGSGPVVIDLMIVGGESGGDARPMHPDWARSLRDQCNAAGVSYFFKQWGEWVGGHDFASDSDDEGNATRPRLYGELQNGEVVIEDELPEGKWHSWDDDEDAYEQINAPISVRVGKKAAGRLLDNREWNEMPQRPAAKLPGAGEVAHG